MSKLYIAYGSNLSKTQMRRRCPTARPLGKFMLKDARLVFRGVADLDFVPGEETPCGLWSINADDESALDVAEGISIGAYFKSEEIVLSYAGRRRKAVIYLKNSEGVYPPTAEYARVIRQGYRDFKLDESYLDRAIAQAWENKSPDDEIIARRRRQRVGKLHRDLAARPGSFAGALGGK
jgi:hypothetical protein